MLEIKPPILKDTTKEEFQQAYSRLLDLIKSRKEETRSHSKEIDLCSCLYTKGKEEKEVGYYTKLFVEQSSILYKKIEGFPCKN